MYTSSVQILKLTCMTVTDFGCILICWNRTTYLTKYPWVICRMSASLISPLYYVLNKLIECCFQSKYFAVGFNWWVWFFCLFCCMLFLVVSNIQQIIFCLFRTYVLVVAAIWVELFVAYASYPAYDILWGLAWFTWSKLTHVLIFFLIFLSFDILFFWIPCWSDTVHVNCHSLMFLWRTILLHWLVDMDLNDFWSFSHLCCFPFCHDVLHTVYE